MATPPIPLPRPDRRGPPLPVPRPEERSRPPLTALEMYDQRRSGLTRFADSALGEWTEADNKYGWKVLQSAPYMIPTSVAFGLIKGIGKMGGNFAALFGTIPQKEVDKFFAEADKQFGDFKVALMDGDERGRKSFEIAQGAGEIGAFVVPALGLARILSVVTGASPLLATASADAFLSFGGLSPDDQNMFNLIKDISESDDPKSTNLLNDIADLLATDREDNEYTNRARNVAEALVFYLPVQESLRFLNKARASVIQGKKTEQNVRQFIRGATPEAQKKLASVLEPTKGDPNAVGVDIDSAKAPVKPLPGDADEALLQKAQDGDVAAQDSLATMYYYGGESFAGQDFAEAAKWYHKAAEQGSPGAQQKLGVMYTNGWGVPVDVVEAEKWSSKASSSSSPESGDLPGVPTEEWLGTHPTLPPINAQMEDLGLGLPPTPAGDNLAISAGAKEVEAPSAVYKTFNEKYEKIGKKPGGSAEGAIYRDTDTGIEYLIKEYKDDEMAVTEVMASRYYQALGVPTTQLSIINKDGKLVVRSEMVTLEKFNFNELKDNASAARQAGRIHAASALLKDRDVFGVDGTNVQVLVRDSTNKVMVQIDAGGSGKWRAQGELKKGDNANFDAGAVDRDFTDVLTNPQSSASTFLLPFWKSDPYEYAQGMRDVLDNAKGISDNTHRSMLNEVTGGQNSPGFTENNTGAVDFVNSMMERIKEATSTRKGSVFDRVQDINIVAKGARKFSVPKADTYGVLILNDAGEILLRKPTGEFGGYKYTFAKGGSDPGETPLQTALRELYEETGYTPEIIGVLPKAYQGTVGNTSAYFVGRIKEFDPKAKTPETEEVVFADPASARALIIQGTTPEGMARDLLILDDMGGFVKNLTDPAVNPSTNPVKTPGVSPSKSLANTATTKKDLFNYLNQTETSIGERTRELLHAAASSTEKNMARLGFSPDMTVERVSHYATPHNLISPTSQDIGRLGTTVSPTMTLGELTDKANSFNKDLRVLFKLDNVPSKEIDISVAPEGSSGHDYIYSTANPSQTYFYTGNTSATKIKNLHEKAIVAANQSGGGAKGVLAVLGKSIEHHVPDYFLDIKMPQNPNADELYAFYTKAKESIDINFSVENHMGDITASTSADANEKAITSFLNIITSNAYGNDMFRTVFSASLRESIPKNYRIKKFTHGPQHPVGNAQYREVFDDASYATNSLRPGAPNWTLAQSSHGLKKITRFLFLMNKNNTPPKARGPENLYTSIPVDDEMRYVAQRINQIQNTRSTPPNTMSTPMSDRHSNSTAIMSPVQLQAVVGYGQESLGKVAPGVPTKVVQSVGLDIQNIDPLTGSLVKFHVTPIKAVDFNTDGSINKSASAAFRSNDSTSILKSLTLVTVAGAGAVKLGVGEAEAEEAPKDYGEHLMFQTMQDDMQADDTGPYSDDPYGTAQDDVLIIEEEEDEIEDPFKFSESQGVEKDMSSLFPPEEEMWEPVEESLPDALPMPAITGDTLDVYANAAPPRT
jgi:TPR repeat protein/8-oxo-dGTP pyrophosphatase MutT (NUDIX family)